MHLALNERAIHDQLNNFSQHFNVYLPAFRPWCRGQSTLLGVIEDWKQALDKYSFVANILMGLLKTFDCLSLDLLKL